MLEHKKIRNLNDYFVDLNSRQDKGVYFYRLNAYSDEIGGFIKKYYEIARRSGVVIEGKIPNPDEKNLAYYNEIMGMDFQMSVEFIDRSLKKWLPRMNELQRKNVADSIFDSLNQMSKSGKTENMLKNAYIKFMCWLYYKFERIVNQLGENELPKILYEGSISKYELMLVSIISNAGCDVVLLQYQGDAEYLKEDPSSVLSDSFPTLGLQPFPQGYCIKQVRDDIQNDLNNERMYGQKPVLSPSTNTWLKGEIFEDLRTLPTMRGTDSKYYYNCFCRVNGAANKMTYTNELFKFQQDIRNEARKLVIVNEEIPKPNPSEIAGIRRGNYAKVDQLILDLSKNVTYPANAELQRVMHKAFVDIFLSESKKDGENINRLTNKAVYLLCWLKRYTTDLFSGWKEKEVSCFIHMGGCQNETEALFLKFLSKLPVDVVILCPDLEKKCCLADMQLQEVNYPESVSLKVFPENNTQISIGTVAYHAERELDDMMYQDSGMYRNQQYAKANIIHLQTMYEEIKILWDQELKYRPSFSTSEGVVNIPVIFAKISGVKDGNYPQYWSSIKELMTEDTVVISRAPYIKSSDSNPMKAFATDFYKNGKLQKKTIKEHPKYPYGILREEIQDFMLDRLEVMIQQKLIKGIGENGTEYTVVAQVLRLPKDIIRRIQNFDFTKKNPKLIYVNTTETPITLEDTIFVTYLNLIGFDVLFFVPTGYQSVEKFFNQKIMDEHQIGEYKYDMAVPEWSTVPTGSKHSWKNIFKRSN